MEKENLTAAGVSDLLNKKSGVKGIFGVSSDMRELEAAVAAGNNKMADLTEKMYFYRIKKYIGAYAAALGGVDIIVFTGGVGENQASCRSGACEGLEYMGVKLDLVQKAGSWFSMGETRIGQGRDAAKKYLQENPEVMEKLEADIRADFDKLMSNQARIAAKAAGRAVDVSADDFKDEDLSLIHI